MDSRFRLLASLNAGDFQHLNGSLENHLKRTSEILKKWWASDLLQTAGLFHAAYGTANFDQNMVSLKQRKAIAQAIGEDEEALVYLYCACDREFVFPQFGNQNLIIFKDRFNQHQFQLSVKNTLLFCELTAANELELIYASEVFKQEHGKGLFDLFNRMQPFLSENARNAFRDALADAT